MFSKILISDKIIDPLSPFLQKEAQFDEDEEFSDTEDFNVDLPKYFYQDIEQEAVKINGKSAITSSDVETVSIDSTGSNIGSNETGSDIGSKETGSNIDSNETGKGVPFLSTTEKIPPPIAVDKDNPNIYIVLDSVDEKGKRRQNHRHYCALCPSKVLHISQHLLLHKADPEVNAILKLKEAQKGRGKKSVRAQDLFRYKGDHQHNMTVLEKKTGELVVARRVFSPGETFSVDDFGPCPECLQWVVKANFQKHLSVCPELKAKNLSNEQTILESDIITNRIPGSLTKEMLINVLGRMRPTPEANVVKKDKLIQMLAEFWWYRSGGHELNRRRVCSERVLRAAKLLLYVQKIAADEKMTEFPQNLTMWDILRPKYMDALMVAAIMICSPPGSDEQYKHPSAAIKVKSDILRMCREKSRQSGKLMDMSTDKVMREQAVHHRDQAEQVYADIKEEWRYRVTNMAQSILDDRARDKLELLPCPKDMKKLTVFLLEELKRLDLSDGYVTWEQYMRNACVCMTRLYIFNRRRPLEVSSLQVTAYRSRSTASNLDEVLIGKLSVTEKKYFDSFDLMKTRGKGNSTVPVLVPIECHESLKWLNNHSVRAQVGIEKQKYIFASGSSKNPVLTPKDALQMLCKEAGLIHPERLTGCGVRHFMATMTQALALNDFQFQHVLKHMGHSRKVHLENYRLQAPAIERLEIAKILLMQDRGVQSNFRDKPLSEISYEEILSAGTDPDERQDNDRDEGNHGDRDQGNNGDQDQGNNGDQDQGNNGDQDQDNNGDQDQDNNGDETMMEVQEQSEEETETMDERVELRKPKAKGKRGKSGQSKRKLRNNRKRKMSSANRKFYEKSNFQGYDSEGDDDDTYEPGSHSNDSDDSDVEVEYSPRKKTKTAQKGKRSHVSWVDLEEELHEIFAQAYKDNKTPSRTQVSNLLMLKQASDELRARGAANIVKKISADIMKVKRVTGK